MRKPSVETKQLRYFIAVAEAGAFRSAASQLHISQPPLTRHVRALEEELGVSLFIRKSKGVELTLAGKSYLEEAKNILDLLDRATERTILLKAEQLEQLDIGICGPVVFGTDTYEIIPRIIQTFKKKFPNVKVILHNLDRTAQLKALREFRIIAGFNRFFDEENDLSWETVLSEPMSIALHQQHPLACRTELLLEEVDDEPMVVYPRTARPSFIDHLYRIFQNQNLSLNIALEVDDVTTAIALVSSGFGISLVTQSACNLLLPNVIYIPLVKKSEGAEFDLDIIFRKQEESKILHDFLSIIKEARKKEI